SIIQRYRLLLAATSQAAKTVARLSPGQCRTALAKYSSAASTSPRDAKYIAASRCTFSTNPAPWPLPPSTRAPADSPSVREGQQDGRRRPNRGPLGAAFRPCSGDVLQPFGSVRDGSGLLPSVPCQLGRAAGSRTTPYPGFPPTPASPKSALEAIITF